MQISMSLVCQCMYNAVVYSVNLLWILIVFGKDCWFANLKLCDHKESIFLSSRADTCT